MIKKLYFAAILVGNLLLSSCDSYLDIQPVGKVIPNTLSEYRALLTTAYNKGSKIIDKGIIDFRSDMAVVGSTSTAQNAYSDIEKWNDITPSNTTREFLWEDFYYIIYYANAIIDKQNQITEGNQEEIDQLVGEAYLLRGYTHFILVNFYGQPYTKEGGPESKSIPLKWDLDLEATPSRNTVREIYTAILADIESARKLIHQETWEKKYSYRFSTLSVDAMESRVRLYMGEWKEAYDAAELVLAKKANLEDLNLENSKLPNDQESVETITAYEVIYYSVFADQALLSASFMAKYTVGQDLRSTKYYGSANKDGNYPSLKGKKNCTFRTGELYLNSAEAAARLNKLPEARTRLLKLMECRYTPTSYAEKKNLVNAMNQDQLITEILNERALELAFEGHRWFDLRRTTRPEIRKDIAGTTYILRQDDSRYTLRIPQKAIDANPGLLN